VSLEPGVRAALETAAEWVWERYDVDLDDLLEPSELDTLYDDETSLPNPAYDEALVEFLSHLATADALRQAANLRQQRTGSWNQ
jgi:hypothetical protein